MKEKKKGNKLKVAVIILSVILGLILLLFAAAIMTSNSKGDASVVLDENNYVAGNSVLVEVGSVADVLKFTGTITPKDQEIFYAEGDGTVTEVYVNVGDYVEPGSDLYKLEIGGTNYITESTITGNISSLNIAAGERIKQNKTLAVVADVSYYYFNTTIDETNINKIYKDQYAEAELRSFPDRIFPLTVTQIDSVKNGNSGGSSNTGYAVELTFTEIDPAFRSDMSGTGKIFLTSVDNVLRLPLKALVLIGNGKAEVVVRENGEYFVKEISVGLIGNEYVEITEGLNDGDLVYLEQKTNK